MLVISLRRACSEALLGRSLEGRLIQSRFKQRGLAACPIAASRVRALRGATMVEFAVVISFILFFVIMASQLLYMSYTSLALQFVASRIVRAAAVGPSAPATPAAWTQEVENSVIRTARGLLITLTPEQIHVCPAEGAGAGLLCSQDSTGHPGSLITVYIEVPFSIPFYGRPIYTVTALAVGRNEFFEN